MSLLSNLTLNVSPDEGSILGQIVTLVVPGGLATSSCSSITQGKIDAAQILDVDFMPDILALTNQNSRAT
jgi:hypothetical protein